MNLSAMAMWDGLIWQASCLVCLVTSQWPRKAQQELLVTFASLKVRGHQPREAITLSFRLRGPMMSALGAVTHAHMLPPPPRGPKSPETAQLTNSTDPPNRTQPVSMPHQVSPRMTAHSTWLDQDNNRGTNPSNNTEQQLRWTNEPYRLIYHFLETNG